MILIENTRLLLLVAIVAVGSYHYLTIANASDSDCGSTFPVFPGIRHMFRGVDVTTLDIMRWPLVNGSNNSTDNGLRESLFKMSCKQNRSFQHSTDRSALPDQLMQTISGSVNSTCCNVTICVHTPRVREFMQHLMADSGANFTAQFGFFTQSSRIAWTEREILTRGNLIAETYPNVAYSSFAFIHNESDTKLEISDQFRAAIPTEPYASDSSAYDRFLDRFGTHYIDRAMIPSSGDDFVLLQATVDAQYYHSVVDRRRLPSFNDMLIAYYRDPNSKTAAMLRLYANFTRENVDHRQISQITRLRAIAEFIPDKAIRDDVMHAIEVKLARATLDSLRRLTQDYLEFQDRDRWQSSWFLLGIYDPKALVAKIDDLRKGYGAAPTPSSAGKMKLIVLDLIVTIEKLAKFVINNNYAIGSLDSHIHKPVSYSR